MESPVLDTTTLSAHIRDGMSRLLADPTWTDTAQVVGTGADEHGRYATIVVQSEDGTRSYPVRFWEDTGVMSCGCPAGSHGRPCKHVAALAVKLAPPRTEEARRAAERDIRTMTCGPLFLAWCPTCDAVDCAHCEAVQDRRTGWQADLRIATPQDADFWFMSRTLREVAR